ncbi:unnamed protein product [marine sediment metagenome]|uniref:Uncharacterized protein n=1 Tax=marine sediment metagenome TaxID=412755 RepID=X0UP86_9ZZZZ
MPIIQNRYLNEAFNLPGVVDYLGGLEDEKRLYDLRNLVATLIYHCVKPKEFNQFIVHIVKELKNTQRFK